MRRESYNIYWFSKDSRWPDKIFPTLPLVQFQNLIEKDTASKLKDELEHVEERLASVMPMSVKLASKAEVEGAVKQVIIK